MRKNSLYKMFIVAGVAAMMMTGCGSDKNKDTDNSRTGHSSKTLRTSFGEVDVSVPRDRKGEFEPQVLKRTKPASVRTLRRRSCPCTPKA